MKTVKEAYEEIKALVASNPRFRNILVNLRLIPVPVEKYCQGMEPPYSERYSRVVAPQPETESKLVELKVIKNRETTQLIQTHDRIIFQWDCIKDWPEDWPEGK